MRDVRAAMVAPNCFFTIDVSMRMNAPCLTAMLALAAAGYCPLPVAAQTNAGGSTRSQPRAAPRQDAPVAANSRIQTAAPRGQANAADAPDGKAAPPKGDAQTSAGSKQAAVPKGFNLTESQQKLLDQILIKWEKQSDKVKTFKCTFGRWEYDPTWGPKAHDYLTSKGQGEIRYSAPDQGEFRVTELLEYDPKKVDYVRKKDGLDNWVCNGKAIFEFNSQKKQLIERRLPPEMRGKAISDGPLPFIFGAKADQLKRRYWMRDTTPKEEIGKTIWLEAVPRFQQDAANFQRATVVLNEADFMPYALRIFLPGGNSDTAYKFENNKVNGLLAAWDATAPRLTPSLVVQGWKHIIEKEPADEPKDEPAPPDEPKQAKRPAQRK
jgi:TIGR03009 family protein